MDATTSAKEIGMAKRLEHETVRAKLRFPHEDSALAIYLTKQINALVGVKSQREIAAEVGYDRPNIISMMKRGNTKLPLDKVPAFAKALHVDPAHLFRLALMQQMPEVAKVVAEVMGHTVSAHELEIVQMIRKATKNADPKASAAQLRQIKEMFS